MPAAGANPASLAAFLKRSDAALVTFLKEAGILLPAGSLVALDPENLTLVCRTTTQGHVLIAAYSDQLMSRLGKTLHFSVDLIEAEAATVRQLIKETSNQSDHFLQLAKLRALIGEGKARHVDLLRLETRSGQRAVVESGAEGMMGSKFELYEDGPRWTSASSESRLVGSRFEIDPVLSPDGVTLDVHVAVEHHYRAPKHKWVAVAGKEEDTVQARLVDYYTADILSAQTMMANQCRMLGVCRPEGVEEPARADVLLMAFLRGTKVPVIPPMDSRVEEILKAHGEAVRATPKVVPAPDSTEASGIPAGMVLRRFKITAKQLSQGVTRGESSASSADPFSASAPPADEPRMTVQFTALDILRAHGIDFPKGASANFNSTGTELIVRNTPENMEVMEALYAGCGPPRPPNILFTLHVVQADGVLLRKLESECATLADHSAAWGELEGAMGPPGSAKYLQTFWMGTRSGNRSALRVGPEFLFSTGASVAPGGAAVVAPAGEKKGPAAEGAGSRLKLGFIPEMRHVGLNVEIDPVLGPDGRTIDLHYAIVYHFAPPSLRPEAAAGAVGVTRMDSPGTTFHFARTTSAVTVLPGMMRLVGLWKPGGTPEFDNADILQAAFLHAEIQTFESAEEPAP
jgi:hypothetical protein